MKIPEVKEALDTVEAVNFKLPDGSTLPPHFHVTELGLVTKHFIDCGIPDAPQEKEGGCC